MSQAVDNLIASEVAYLSDNGKGFDTCVDIILICRKYYNDIVSSYMDNGKSDTMPMVRELAGHIDYAFRAMDMPVDVGSCEPKMGFGHYVIGLDELSKAAEAACALMQEDVVAAELSAALNLLRGWLAKYSMDVNQREGYEVAE